LQEAQEPPLHFTVGVGGPLSGTVMSPGFGSTSPGLGSMSSTEPSRGALLSGGSGPASWLLL